MYGSAYPVIGSEENLPIYITGVGIESQSHITRPSGFPDFQVIYCAGGSGIFIIDSKKYEMSEGTGFFLYPNDPHEYYPVDKPWETHWVTFKGNAALDSIKALGFQKSGVFYISDMLGLEDLLKQILSAAESENIENGYVSSALIYSFLISLKFSVSEEPHAQKEKRMEQILPVISYVDSHFSECLSLSGLAGLIGVSGQYLCRLFKDCYGLRPFEYIAKRRIQEAKKLLLADGMPVYDVALKAGFGSSSYFCSVFKQYEKITPNQFRNLHRNF